MARAVFSRQYEIAEGPLDLTKAEGVVEILTLQSSYAILIDRMNTDVTRFRMRFATITSPEVVTSLAWKAS